MVDPAIILAAGKGMRLGSLTETLPKCLVSVAGKPILVRMLENFQNAGIKEIAIVTGYQEGEIKKRIGSNFQGMRISYISNPKYETTNNIYSLWLAKEFLKKEVIITAGDILVKKQVIFDVVRNKVPNIGVVSEWRPGLNGTAASLNGGVIDGIFLKKDQHADFDYADKFKTVNIFKLSPEFLQDVFLPRLDQFIQNSQLSDFYEIALRDIIREGRHSIYMHLIEGSDWYEVDTPEELAEAEKIVSGWK